MLGSIVAVAVAVWFYYSAKQAGRQPISWALAGLLFFFIIELLWTNLVTPPIKDAAMHSKNPLLMFITRYAYIAVGLACAAFFNIKFVGKKKD